MLSERARKVVKFVQELLLDEQGWASITPTTIREKIALVIKMKPAWGEGLDENDVIDELIRRFSVWMGTDTTIKNDVGHVPWLNAARKQGWRYWQRYRDWLEADLPWAAVDALDRTTDGILGLLEDPERTGTWDRRGLVVGHVQSGKTGNYTGLICKAADAGYKIIIVLAGMHNNLRSQTQIRLEEGFLGFATGPNPEYFEFVGAGSEGRDAAIKPNCATNRTESGDFNSKIANNLAVTPEQRPWLFVVKKNKTVLQRLLDWVRNHVADTVDHSTNRKIVSGLPLLVIDDEADHASIDTGEQVFKSDGTPDEEHEPTAINSRIRKLLLSFSRSAYVGYTATPFANVFIHEKGVTLDEGPDLFPAAFIINLAAPSDYIGPARMFGLGDQRARKGALPLDRSADDCSSEDGREGWMPRRHGNGHIPVAADQELLPSSLIKAIDSFVLACAARRLRGQASEHCSMLIHVTRFNSVQREVHRQVDEHLRRMRQRLSRGIDCQSILSRLEELWNTDFLPTTKRVHEAAPGHAPELPAAWIDVREVLNDSVAEIEVRMINGTAKDALDYVQNKGKGLKVIAIGGDKLARGLTLEGLCVSYFLRASRMYDTLMQMGRWFGYRRGYLDLSRLYTTRELIEWFKHITDASEELREEFDMMASQGATPREYGLKVQSHPVLMVTSRLKMRTARNLMLSFSGQLLETVSLYREEAILHRNLETARRFVSSLGDAEVDPVRVRDGKRTRWDGYVWENVPSGEVIRFLLSYRTHPDAYKVNSALIAEFIESLAATGELTAWSVALIGGGEGSECRLSPSVKLNMLKRSSSSTKADRYSIGRLLSPRDESIDLDEAAWLAALAATRKAWHADPARMKSDSSPPEIPSGHAVRQVRGFGSEGVVAHPDRGLLLLYLLDPSLADAEFPQDAPPIVAIGVSFPGSDTALKVEYKVNNILWEQEYGSAD